MYSRHVYGSNIPLKYTVMLWYQQLYLRNKVSMFWACLFSKIFEPCLFSNGRLLPREYGIHFMQCLKESAKMVLNNGDILKHLSTSRCAAKSSLFSECPF